MKVALTLGVFLVMVSFSFSNAYAETMDWKVIFVSSSSSCSSYEKSNESWFFTLVAYYSFNQYNFDHQYYDPDCISINEFTEKTKEYQRTFDLPIFVLDRDLSKEQSASTGYAGHYYSSGVNNIVTQAKDVDQFKYSAFTLSHEIAHASFDWLGYSGEVRVDMVHALQDDFNECKYWKSNDNYEINLLNCQYLWSEAETNNGIIPIMSPQKIFDEIDRQKAINQQEYNIKKSTAERLEREKQKESLYQDRYNKIAGPNAKNYEECLAFAVDRNSCAFLRPNNYQYQPKTTGLGYYTDYVEPEKTDEQQAYHDAQEQFKLNRQLKQWEDERKLKLENNPIPEIEPEKETHTSTYILKKPAEPNYFSDFMSQIQDFFSSLRWG